MKVKVLVTVVSVISLSWLGMSFAIPSDEPADTSILPVLPEQLVGAGHPDSHRLGELMMEEVVLPAWDEETAGTELALAGD